MSRFLFYNIGKSSFEFEAVMEIKLGGPIVTVVPPDTRLAVLREINGSRVVSISLSNLTLALLTWEIQNTENRPEIFKFTFECISAMNGNIEKVVINDTDSENVYHAYVSIIDNREGRTYQLKLQVTNALILAVAAKCPIFITDEALRKSENQRQEMPEKNYKNDIQRIFDELDPDESTKN